MTELSEWHDRPVICSTRCQEKQNKVPAFVVHSEKCRPRLKVVQAGPWYRWPITSLSGFMVVLNPWLS